MKLLTKDLTGNALSYAVNLAYGIPTIRYETWINKYIDSRPEQRRVLAIARARNWLKDLVDDKPGVAASVAPKYASDWNATGPVIDDEICTLIKRDEVWEAECFYPKPPSERRFCYSSKGETASIASMRAFITSRLGAEVEVPDEIAN